MEERFAPEVTFHENVEFFENSKKFSERHIININKFRIQIEHNKLVHKQVLNIVLVKLLVKMCKA